MREIDELGAAAAALGDTRTLDALEATLAAWRAPGSPWVERLAREHKIFSREVIARGIALGLEPWSRARLEALRESALGADRLAPRVTAVWLGGCIPTASFAAVLLPLLAGSAVYAKPASADPKSALLFAESLQQADLRIGACLRVGNDPAALQECDAVVAFGSDQTIEALRARVPATKIFVGHGHRVSLACVGAAAELGSAASGLASDLALWDGRGCLSPGWVLVEDRGTQRANELAGELAAALERVEKELPRGELEPFEAVRVRELRARAAVRSDTVQWSSADSTAWTVILHPPRSRPEPGCLRVIPVVPVSDLAELASFCRGLSPHLSSLGHAGFEGREEFLARGALEAGASRLCPLGRLQLPPIEWRHDGIEPIRSLLRTIDVEKQAR